MRVRGGLSRRISAAGTHRRRRCFVLLARSKTTLSYQACVVFCSHLLAAGLLAVLGTDQQFLDAKHRGTQARHRGQDREREGEGGGGGVVGGKEREEEEEEEREEDRETATNKVRVPSFLAGTRQPQKRSGELQCCAEPSARAHERRGRGGSEGTERCDDNEAHASPAHLLLFGHAVHHGGLHRAHTYSRMLS
jgi:hypothetical protein